jgi:hypothetical protein
MKPVKLPQRILAKKKGGAKENRKKELVHVGWHDVFHVFGLPLGGLKKQSNSVQ